MSNDLQGSSCVKGNRVLYACSSYYQLYISLAKALSEGIQIDLVLEEHGIETAKELAEKLGKLKQTVGRVFVCEESSLIDPYVQRQSSFIPSQRKLVLSHMDACLKGADLARDYRQICIYWDLGFTGTYCNIRKIHYVLQEDSLNSYQHIRANRPHYAYIFAENRIPFLMKKWFGIGVIPFGYSRFCDQVEVNEIKGIEIPTDKVREVPRQALIDSLSEEQKAQIFSAFMPENFSLQEKEQGAVLLLTEPFAVTDRLKDEETQIRLYRDVIRLYADGKKILIKAHPRDPVDYGKYFPEAEILEKNVPIEVLNFDPRFKVEKAITVSSSAVYGLKCAGEKISLGADFLNPYKE